MITRRWLATMIDMLVLLILCGLVGSVLPDTDVAGVLLVFGVPFVYYVALESAFGKTIGKLATGLVVINDDGASPSFRAVLVRTLTRYLEVNPILLGGLPAGIIADRSKARQRLGDMLAKTYVVFSKDRSRLFNAAPTAAAVPSRSAERTE